MTQEHQHLPIPVGLAGLGLGAALTVPYIASDPRFRIVAAADPRPEARDAFVAAVGGRVYQTVEGVASDPEVELVYISTPHFMHREHALVAIDAGRHVLVEKPLARTAEDATAIVDAARRTGMRALYGHTHALDPVVQAMADLVRSGEMGALGSVLNLNYNDLLYRPRAAWELDASISGGSPFIQGAHQIDIVRWIAGSPVTRVMGWSATLDPERPMPATHAAMLQFASGAAATMLLSGYAHFDSARWIGWRAESGDPRPHSTHQDTLRGYAARRVGSVDESEARNARRIGAQPFQTRVAADRHETFGVTIVSAARGDVRQVASGLLLEGEGGRRRVPIPPRSGRSVMLDTAHRAIRLDMEVEIDAAWGVETVRIAQVMEHSGIAARGEGELALLDVPGDNAARGGRVRER